MKRITFLILVSLVTSGAAVALSPDGWEGSLSPGPVHADHADAECGECHSPWRGVTDEGCVGCHEGVDTPGNESHELHSNFTSSCVSCHDDHDGANASLTFSVDHESLTGNCESCHGSGLDEAFPSGHWDSDCGDCHGTEDWDRITLDHREYFPLTGDHAIDDCSECHPNRNNLEEWTCYSDCHHEHTEQAVRSEHREEGISDYDPCLECHPTGREHEGGEFGEEEHDD